MVVGGELHRGVRAGDNMRFLIMVMVVGARSSETVVIGAGLCVL